MPFDGSNFDNQARNRRLTPTRVEVKRGREKSSPERLDFEQWSGGEIAPGTRPTVTTEYLREQAEKRKIQSKKIQRAEKNRQKRVKFIAHERPKIWRIATNQGGVKGVAKIRKRQIKAVRATWLAAMSCSVFSFWQLVFGVITLIGFGLAADNIDLEEILGLGMVKEFALWAAGKVLPGDAIFMSGWLLASLAAILQLLTTFVIYMANGVNPLRGSGLQSLAIYFALSMGPFGVVPWAYLWMWSVVKNHRQ